MNPGYTEPGGRIGGERHVDRLRERRGIEDRGYRVDASGLAVEHREAGGGVHPRIRNDDEDPGQGAARGDDDARPEVRASRQPVPPIEIDAEEDRFHEERETLE